MTHTIILIETGYHKLTLNTADVMELVNNPNTKSLLKDGKPVNKSHFKRMLTAKKNTNSVFTISANF